MIINTKSGNLGKQLPPEDIQAALEKHGLSPEIHMATSSRSINQFIRAARERRPRSVLIAGGDGTIGTVLKGLLDVPTIFGLIPTGSLNNLSGTIGLTGELEQALRVIKHGKTRRFDVARAGNDIMFEALGLGMFAEILDKTDWDTEKKVGQMVARSAIQVVTQEPIQVTATVDGKRRKFQTIWLAVANTPKLGALTLDPTARIDDGLLELLYCRPLTGLELPKYTLSFMKGDHLQEDKFERVRGKHIRLSFAQGTTIHIDERVHQRSRLDVQVLPGALEIYAP
jgi:YegS/Rv2252/BmrU family lipid kinase